MNSKLFFPKKLFIWFSSRQVVLSILCLVLLDLLLFLHFDARPDLNNETLEVVREVILFSLFSAVIVMLFVSLLMARSLMTPLGRIIEKSKRLGQLQFDEEVSESEWAVDEVGEWYDLEVALNKLRIDLEQKTIRLSREKTELRAIMSAISEAVVAVDLHKHVLFYNSQFAMIFQPKISANEGGGLSEVVRAPDILEACESSLREGRAIRTEAQVQLDDQRTHIFMVSVAPLKKKHNGEIYGAVAILHDISELKKAEKVRIEFVGNVSHELRTPLTSIKGYVQALQSDFTQKRYEMIPQFLDIVTKNVDRLIFLVTDLLDLSSLESGSDLNVKPVNVKTLTEAVIKQLPLKEHVVTTHYAVSDVKADPIRLEQVLSNLLQNASRYVPKGKSITVSWEFDASGSTLLRVKDNGPGIPKSHQERIFERFYRVDEARSRELGGTGIGLSLVKHIVQRHGGQVSVISDEGHGAEFICSFPNAL